MKRGDLVYTNLFGVKNTSGILLTVQKLPKDALEFYRCTVLIGDGTVKMFTSSQLLTVEEMEEFGFDRDEYI